MPPRVNLRSSAVKRIMQEAAEPSDPETDGFVAAPLETDIFEWHCTLRGVKGTDYEGGLYHLRILLPATYPMSAPDIVLLTPNGRFELGKKICIDGLTSFHAGSWQPAWGVRTAITGLRAFWTQEGEALSAIGALDVPKAERRRLARLSRDWTCPTCGECNATLLPDAPERDESNADAGPSAQTSDDVEEAGGSGQVAPEQVPDAPVAVSPSDASVALPASDTSVDAPLPLFASSSTEASGSTESRGVNTSPIPGPSLPNDTMPTADDRAAAGAPAAPPSPPAQRPPDAPEPVAPEPVQPSPPPRLVVSPPPQQSPAHPAAETELRARAVPAPRPASPAAARPLAPAPPRDAPNHAHAVPARFTAPPQAAPPAPRPPLWLDVLIGALVVLLLVLLSENR